MMWQPKWPFSTRDHALAHEQAYLQGYAPPGSSHRRIQLVERDNLDTEAWLESCGADRLRAEPNDKKTIRAIWLWKMRSTLEVAGQCTEPPKELFGPRFAACLENARDAINASRMATAVADLVNFDGVAVRSASAFVYWLRPNEYQVIDRRATGALDLDFKDEDYTTENYLRYCTLSLQLSTAHALTLRQVDRALFSYHKLLTRAHPVAIPP
ncbi:MAG: hypothetical protein JW395_0764 [Nitrospira sp.]|nr:hypothetical protein [Nitrospira sp.]